MESEVVRKITAYINYNIHYILYAYLKLNFMIIVNNE